MCRCAVAGQVGRQAGAFLAWMCGAPGIFPERLSYPWTLESLHLLPPLYYGSNPSFSCAHHGYSRSPTVGEFLQLPPGCCLKRWQRCIGRRL